MVSGAGGGWLAITADQRDIGAVRSAAERIEREWGGVDIVFANAGIQAFKPILEMDDPDWHDQVDVNLNGTANVLRVFAPLLVRRGGGRIIITSSTQGEHGTKFGSSYSASKWGLIGLMKSAALAPVVAFLASDEARMVSGASFAVTAGDSANMTA